MSSQRCPICFRTICWHPVYTRPAEFNGWRVPDVLLSGNEKLIKEWQMEQSLERTKRLRPNLLND